MYIDYDEDEYETVIETRRCHFHEMNPSSPAPRGYCGCWFGAGQRRRTPSEIRAVKEKRRREEEDRILAEAEVIRARREMEAQIAETPVPTRASAAAGRPLPPLASDRRGDLSREA